MATNRWMQAVVSTSLQGFCSANSSHGLELKVIVVVVVLYALCNKLSSFLFG